MVANDGHAVSMHRSTGTRGDKSLDINVALVFHIRDGQAVEVFELFSDQYAEDEFWA